MLIAVLRCHARQLPRVLQQQLSGPLRTVRRRSLHRALERLPCVPAGNVCAIAGLETCILKSATLACSPAALPLAAMTFQAAPIVRVALEPAQPGDMAALAEGLKLLNRCGRRCWYSSSRHVFVHACVRAFKAFASVRAQQRTAHTAHASTAGRAGVAVLPACMLLC